jgi:hypothetical protein
MCPHFTMLASGASRRAPADTPRQRGLLFPDVVMLSAARTPIGAFERLPLPATALGAAACVAPSPAPPSNPPR